MACDCKINHVNSQNVEEVKAEIVEKPVEIIKEETPKVEKMPEVVERKPRKVFSRRKTKKR